jgi:hypothetical protein
MRLLFVSPAFPLPIAKPLKFFRRKGVFGG